MEEEGREAVYNARQAGDAAVWRRLANPSKAEGIPSPISEAAGSLSRLGGLRMPKHNWSLLQ